MTVRDVAAYLNVNEKTVYRLAQSGEIPGFKVAGAWRFQRADLDTWIGERKQEAKRSRGESSRTSRAGASCPPDGASR
jgi:excisionase family DNA binding protein